MLMSGPQLPKLPAKLPEFEPGLPTVGTDRKRVDRFVSSMTDKIEEGANVVILKKGETLVQGLRRMEEEPGELVYDGDGNHACCASITVLGGTIGCATKGGRTFFVPPGNYYRLPINVELIRTKTIHRSAHDNVPEGVHMTSMSWMGITYIALPENYVAVTQIGDQQKILGSGRYILRKPVHCYGAVNIQSLSNVSKVTAITEVSAASVRTEEKHKRRSRMNDFDNDEEGLKYIDADERKEKRLKAGEWEKKGAITFLRARPGFCWVISDASGQLRTGIGYCVARNGDEFKRFVDRQHYSRTTRWFKMESKDCHVVRLRVQIRWRLEDAAKWEMKKGASVDIFDAIEEIGQSHFRDAIASQSYEDCRSQAGQGYEGIEAKVRASLSEKTAELGGRLLGLEIRELRFPLLEAQMRTRADQEAQSKEKVLEEGRRLDIQKAEANREDEKLKAERAVEELELKHNEEVRALDAEQSVIRQRAGAELQKAKDDARAELRLLKLSLEKEKQELELKMQYKREEAESNLTLIRKEAEAKLQMMDSKLQAEISLLKAEAKAESTRMRAEAEGVSVDMMGELYTAKPQFIQLEIAALRAQMLKERAEAMAAAASNNQEFMVPEHIQVELLQDRVNLGATSQL